MNCPDTQHELEEVQRHGVSIDQCVYCGGAWFDAGEFDAIRRYKDGGTPQELEPALRLEHQEGTRPCPACERSTPGFGLLAGQRIDHCASCRGIWVPGSGDTPGGAQAPTALDLSLDVAWLLILVHWYWR